MCTFDEVLLQFMPFCWAQKYICGEQMTNIRSGMINWSYIIKISKKNIHDHCSSEWWFYHKYNSSQIISIITQERRCIKFFNVYKSLIMITNAVQYFCWNFWPTSVNKCNAELRNVAVTICSAIEANFCHDHSSPKIATNFRQKLFKSTLFSLSWLAQMSVLLLENNLFFHKILLSRPTYPLWDQSL